MQSDELKRRISAGRGDALADLVLKNARIVNVFTDEIDTADIAISGNSIVGVGTYHGRKEVDLHGKYVCPGLIDGHIHIESSMLCGPAFEQAVLPHGTTAVVTDPHEISNVAGLEGLDFMLETTKNLTLSVYFMLPSCVPATDLDESGAVLNAEQLRPYYGDPRVLGLAELMNAYGTVRCDPKILQKIRDCTEAPVTSPQSARHICDSEDALSLMLFARIRDLHRPLVPALCVRCRRSHCPLRAGCRRIRHRHLDPPSIHRERESLISHRPRLQPPERHIRSALSRIHRRQPLLIEVRLRGRAGDIVERSRRQRHQHRKKKQQAQRHGALPSIHSAAPFCRNRHTREGSSGNPSFPPTGDAGARRRSQAIPPRS
mgnify:CR=1 FL=1